MKYLNGEAGLVGGAAWTKSPPRVGQRLSFIRAWKHRPAVEGPAMKRHIVCSRRCERRAGDGTQGGDEPVTPLCLPSEGRWFQPVQLSTPGAAVYRLLLPVKHPHCTDNAAVTRQPAPVSRKCSGHQDLSARTSAVPF